MEVIEKSEAFVDKGYDFVFDHTKIIVRRQDDGQYFYARTPARFHSISIINLEGLELIEIPSEEVWPVFNSQFTQAPQPLPDKAYIKRPSLLDFGDTPASHKLSDDVLDEVQVCEFLMQHPHPNVSQYLGCVVEDERITGLCFARYEMTLSEKVRSGVPFDRDACLRDIEDGVKHLHQLGLVHNDLNPRNVMVGGDGNAVIIDFDSCKPEGQELGQKGGTFGWAEEGITHATRGNDFYGISKIREFLMKG